MYSVQCTMYNCSVCSADDLKTFFLPFCADYGQYVSSLASEAGCLVKIPVYRPAFCLIGDKLSNMLHPSSA